MQDTAKVQINAVPYNVVSYDKSDQSVFGPRFGSGAEDESDLTLLKTLTFKANDFGSFAGEKTDFSPYTVQGVADYPNGVMRAPYPATDIPTTAMVQVLSGSGDLNDLTAYDVWHDQTIFAYRTANKNYLYRFDPGTNTIIAITVPASAADAFHSQIITSFARKDNVLYVSNMFGPGLWYINASYVLTKVTGSTSAYQQIFNLNARMYHVDTNGIIIEYIGSPTQEILTAVTKIYDADQNYGWMPYPIAQLNGRAYFGLRGGLWAFDGVRAYEVLNTESKHTQNFKFVVATGGYIYTNKGPNLYRFNGSTLEKIIEFPKNTFFQSASVIDDKLYLSTIAGESDEISKKSDLTQRFYQVGARIWEYDGVNLTLLRQPTYNEPHGKFTSFYVLPTYKGPMIMCSTWASVSYVSENFATLLQIDNDPVDPVEFVFNDESMKLPSINKLIRRVRLEFLKTVNLTTPASDIKLWYKINETSAWTLFKTFTGDNYIYSGNLDVAIPSATRLFFRVTIGGKNVHFQSVSFYYITQPEYRRQWNLMLNPAVNSIDQPTNNTLTYLTNIETLRNSQAVFTFTDLDGSTYNAIVDSFNARVIPTFAPQAGSPPEAQITVVVREV